MNLYNFLPTNKYVWIGFLVMMLGVFTLPFLIGLLIMPVGIVMFVFGIHKAYFDQGKRLYYLYVLLKDKIKLWKK